MDAARQLDWDAVVEAVSTWPQDRRILLIHRLLNTLASEIRAAGEDALMVGASSDAPRQPTVAPAADRSVVGPDPRVHRTQHELESTVAAVIERLRTGRPPPTDDEVRHILDHARWEKYG